MRKASSEENKKEESTYQHLRLELDKINTTIDEAGKLYGTADERLEKFEELLDYLKTEKGKAVVEKFRKKLKILGDTAARFKEYGEHADRLLRIVEVGRQGKPEDFLKMSPRKLPTWPPCSR
ncbi:hypothetical protein ACFL35_11510 [Candidatus Riflebacteria bacterium]